MLVGEVLVRDAETEQSALLVPDGQRQILRGALPGTGVYGHLALGDVPLDFDRHGGGVAGDVDRADLGMPLAYPYPQVDGVVRPVVGHQRDQCRCIAGQRGERAQQAAVVAQSGAQAAPGAAVRGRHVQLPVTF